MPSHRATLYIPWISGLLFLIVLVPTLVQRSFRQDLDILLLASERLYQGLPVYVEGMNPHTKPPFLGMLIWPLNLIPKTALFRIWDFLNFLSFFGLAISFSKYFLPSTCLKTSVSILVLFCLNQLGGEVRYGQFNLLAYALVYYLFFSKRYSLLGSVCFFVTLLKPVNGILFVWGLLAAQENRLRILLSAALSALTCFLLYLALFGWSHFVMEHRIWLRFVEGPIASQWMGTLDGFATWLFQMGLGSSSTISRLVGILAILITSVLTLRVHDIRISFVLVGMLLAVLNPIPFKHNYVVLVGFYAWCFKDFLSPQTKHQKTILLLGFLLTYFSFQIYSPTTFHWAMWKKIKPNTYGFYSTLVLSIGMALPWLNKQTRRRVRA